MVLRSEGVSRESGRDSPVDLFSSGMCLLCFSFVDLGFVNLDVTLPQLKTVIDSEPLSLRSPLPFLTLGIMIGVKHVGPSLLGPINPLCLHS